MGIPSVSLHGQVIRNIATLAVEDGVHMYTNYTLKTRTYILWVVLVHEFLKRNGIIYTYPIF